MALYFRLCIFGGLLHSLFVPMSSSACFGRTLLRRRPASGGSYFGVGSVLRGPCFGIGPPSEGPCFGPDLQLLHGFDSASDVPRSGSSSAWLLHLGRPLFPAAESPLGLDYVLHRPYSRIGIGLSLLCLPPRPRCWRRPLSLLGVGIGFFLFPRSPASTSASASFSPRRRCQLLSLSSVSRLCLGLGLSRLGLGVGSLASASAISTRPQTAPVLSAPWSPTAFPSRHLSSLHDRLIHPWVAREMATWQQGFYSAFFFLSLLSVSRIQRSHGLASNS